MSAQERSKIGKSRVGISSRIITPVVIRKGFTREGKASSVHHIRNYLKKEKNLKGAELKVTVTEDNVMEQWLEHVTVFVLKDAPSRFFSKVQTGSYLYT